MRVIKVLQYFL